jgi:hypothetical protein
LKILLVLTAFAVACSSASATQQKVHLFILSGQSNMAQLDPELSFTPALRNAFGKTNVVVVKDAEKGQSISRWYKKWKSATGKPPEVTGDLYDRLMTKVNEAIKGNTVSTITFVWMQGESDTLERQGEVYAASLQGLHKQIQDDLKRNDIKFIIGRISDHGNANPQWILVRKAQVKVTEADPMAAWVDTDDLNGPHNDLHYTKDGYDKLGKRFAEKAITLIKKSKEGLKNNKKNAVDVQ